MMLGIPLVAAGASVIDPQRSPRAFVLVWLSVAILLVLCVALAMLDAANTWRLTSAARKDAARSTLAMLAASRMSRSRGENSSESSQSAHDD